MVLDATMNQVDAGSLRLGMKAAVRLDAYPGVELAGTVVAIGSMARTSTFRASYVGELPVRLRIEGTDSHLIPDLTGSAEIVLNEERAEVTLPRAAVFEEAGERFVYVKTEEGWTKRTVKIGAESFTRVAIREGVQKDDVVAMAKPL